MTVARSLPVEMQDGTMAMAAFTDAPLEETDVFMPMGLRASYDHIDRYSYDQGGKRMRLSIGINTAGFVLSAGRRRN